MYHHPISVKFQQKAEDWIREPGITGIRCINMKIDSSILPEKQQETFFILKEKEWLNPFYLAGGTALALQYKHRESVDFDFFSDKDFNNHELTEALKKIGETEIFSEEKNTLHTLVNGVQISFLGYKYKLMKAPESEANIKIADHLDIACMKLSAIISRGTKKDFVDLFYLLRHFSLEELFKVYHKKYNLSDHNYILLKSLVYFSDAEEDPMPLVKEDISWQTIKEKIINEVKKT